MNALLFVIGIVLLAGGSELLIRGSLTLARRAGVSALLSGLLIVGFGTSAPELVVSVDAALAQRPGIAIGNVVGSNICNVLMILGVCALISPLTVKPTALRRDALIVVGASVLFLALVGGSSLARVDAVILLFALSAYLVLAYRGERGVDAADAAPQETDSQAVTPLPESGVMTAVTVIGGLFLLIFGSHVLLTGAIGMATQLGVSEAVVGLILVAMGTSMPELSVSIVAAFRRHADVAIGNVLGSNIFNLLGILGVSAILQPLSVPVRVLHFDQWVMLGSALLLVVFLYTGKRLSRLEGGIFVVGYGLYAVLSFTAITA